MSLKVRNAKSGQNPTFVSLAQRSVFGTGTDGGTADEVAFVQSLILGLGMLLYPASHSAFVIKVSVAELPFEIAFFGKDHQKMQHQCRNWCNHKYPNV